MKNCMRLFIIFTLLLAITFTGLPLTSFAESQGNERGWFVLIELDYSSKSIDKGEAFLITATPLVEGTINWTTSNSSVATVTQYGLVVGVSSGTANITASIVTAEPGIPSARCQVTVSSNGVITDAVYFVENAATNKYMEVEGPSNSNGAVLQINELSGVSQLKWNFALGSDGYYRVQSQYSSKYMRVTGSSATAGATITQYSGIVSGSKWALMKKNAGRYVLVPASSTSSLVVLNAPGTTNGYDLNTATYTANTDYKDEWKLTRMLPLSGSEITYGVDDWTHTVACYDPIENEYYDLGNNCYAYALNNQINPVTNEFWIMQQPGDFSNAYGNGQRYTDYTTTAIIAAVEDDFDTYDNYFQFGNMYVITQVSKYTVCSAGTYKVALVIDDIGPQKEKDYHWYRQDSDGLWSHKRGSTDVTRYDASGNLIIDPYTADRDYSYEGLGINYSSFGGYYQITPWNNIEVGQNLQNHQCCDMVTRSSFDNAVIIYEKTE